MLNCHWERRKDGGELQLLWRLGWEQLGLCWSCAGALGTARLVAILPATPLRHGTVASMNVGFQSFSLSRTFLGIQVGKPPVSHGGRGSAQSQALQEDLG